MYGGDGLARLPADEHGPGKAVFVPFVLPGEQVDAILHEEKPGFARARLERVLQASPQRIEPRCPYFQRCGGCHYQHIGYENQLEIKAAILRENLTRIAKLPLDCELIVHASPPWNYRNRSRFKVKTAPEFALGYFHFNSHTLVPVEECPISSPLINRALRSLWAWGRAGTAAGLDEIEIFANAEDSELLLEVYGSAEETSAEKLAEQIRGLLPEIGGVVFFANASAKPSTQIREPRKLATCGAGELQYKTARALYRISAGSFFQVNRHLTEELAALVTQGLSGTLALDLYAGVGLFSTILARSFAQVIAVESSQTSHADLLHNSPQNVRAVCSGTDSYLEKMAGKLRPDVVIVDPPRGGLGERVVRHLSGLKAPRVVYVSCDPSTLARDLRGLLGAGYRVDKAHLIDLFPQTYHLESVFQLRL